MKLREIIARIDRTKGSEYIDPENISRELDVSVPYDAELSDHGFSEYRFIKWLCTDTWVGATCIFLEDAPVCVTYQTARKNDVMFFWLSNEAAETTRERLMKISPMPDVQIQNLDEDFPDGGFQVEYGTQLLTRDVMFEGKSAKVVKTYGDRYENPVENWSKVDIKMGDKVFEKVPLSEIQVPYDILPERPE